MRASITIVKIPIFLPRLPERSRRSCSSPAARNVVSRHELMHLFIYFPPVKKDKTLTGKRSRRRDTDTARECFFFFPPNVCVHELIGVLCWGMASPTRIGRTILWTWRRGNTRLHPASLVCHGEARKLASDAACWPQRPFQLIFRGQLPFLSLMRWKVRGPFAEGRLPGGARLRLVSVRGVHPTDLIQLRLCDVSRLWRCELIPLFTPLSHCHKQRQTHPLASRILFAVIVPVAFLKPLVALRCLLIRATFLPTDRRGVFRLNNFSTAFFFSSFFLRRAAETQDGGGGGEKSPRRVDSAGEAYCRHLLRRLRAEGVNRAAWRRETWIKTVKCKGKLLGIMLIANGCVWKRLLLLDGLDYWH